MKKCLDHHTGLQVPDGYFGWTVYGEYLSSPADSPHGRLLGGWDVSHVTEMSSTMHIQCDFKEDLNCWDVSNVENMEQSLFASTMFNISLEW
jgi:hypothetical protein